VFLPPQPQSLPPGGAQVKLDFRDISGIQKKVEVAFISKRHEGDNWVRDASRVIDERIEVETWEVLTCQPDYDAFSGSCLRSIKIPSSLVVLDKS
jgi:hypothetical protein